jgi:ribose 5-phosphate isomerase B
MKKREFIKKGVALSTSLIAASSTGFGKTSIKGIRDVSNSESDKSMNLVIGSDHAGFPLKGTLISILQSWDYIIKDVGSYNPDPVDFPDIALLIADEIKSGRAHLGIMVCGTGIGAAIVCNKIQGIRAALCHDTYSAHQCVEHDNSNVLCMGAQIIGPSIAEEIMSNFLNAEFSAEEQFRRRVEKVNQFDLVPPVK